VQSIEILAAEIGAELERAPVRRHLRNEEAIGIGEDRIDERKVVRIGVPGKEDVALIVEENLRSRVVLVATEIGAVENRIPSELSFMMNTSL